MTEGDPNGRGSAANNTVREHLRILQDLHWHVPPVQCVRPGGPPYHWLLPWRRQGAPMMDVSTGDQLQTMMSNIT